MLKVEKEKHCSEIERLKEKIHYMEVYQRRENLRFHGIPEAPEENTREVSCKFFENNLKIERECVTSSSSAYTELEQLKKAGQNRPIIARFLRFQNRELHCSIQ